MRIFTLGTDHRPPYDFTRILLKHSIQVVLDLRPNPEAEEEHFRRDRLQSLCEEQGIDYVFLGNELGGTKDKDRHAWVKTDDFQRWLGLIRKKVEKRVVCLLGASRSPERCTRRILAEELAKQGIEVVHLLDETSVWAPRFPPASKRQERPGHFRPPRRH